MKRRHMMLGLALCLMLCSVLVCTASFARYSSQDVQDVEMNADGYAQVILQPVLDENSENALSADLWTTEKAMPFYIANGSQTDYAVADLTVRMQVLLSQGIGDTETVQNVTVTLQCGEQEYIGQRTAIPANSAMQKRFGDGWLYRFYIGDKDEVTWTLPGGEYSQQEMSLLVSAKEELPFDSMMSVEAVACSN